MVLEWNGMVLEWNGMVLEWKGTGMEWYWKWNGTMNGMEWNGNGMVCMPWYGEQSICRHLKIKETHSANILFELKGSYRKGSMILVYNIYIYIYILIPPQRLLRRVKPLLGHAQASDSSNDACRRVELVMLKPCPDGVAVGQHMHEGRFREDE